MKKIVEVVTPELSRPLPVDKVSAGGLVQEILARPDERAALIKRLGLLDLTKLQATLNVDPVNARGVYIVRGSLEAEVVQECVVTLEPVAAVINEKVNVLFAPPKLLETDDSLTIKNDLDDEDPAEPIENNTIDLGEVVVQHLALALDPYPRLPDATLPDSVKAPEGEAEKVPNPFIDLKNYMDMKKK